MKRKFRIPITTITVFGTGALIVLSVGIALYLGFNLAVQSTRQLWADQSMSLIDSMEERLDGHLNPVLDQARWIAAEVHDLSNPAEFDDFVFGALAATPQVAGIAFISKDGKSRRWQRNPRLMVAEDWSTQPWFDAYMQQVSSDSKPQWREPIFSETVSRSTLLHDVALRDREGRFIGVLSQIVPLQNLSNLISNNFTDTGITPFVLYDREFVLAHPGVTDGNLDKPLLSLEALGDLILQRIWSPDRQTEFISSALTNTEARGLSWGDHYYVFIYRNINRFGPAPWTIGAHINTDLASHGETERFFKAMAVGLLVLVVATLAAVVVGRKVSAPVKALVTAANAVEDGDLDTLEVLKGSHVSELDDANNAFYSMVLGLRERRLIRDTLGRFVPEKVASSLLAGGGDIEVQHTEASILFCDIEAFTQLTEALGPEKIIAVLNAYFSEMVDILEAHGGVVTQFQGDAILATFNVPVADNNHIQNAIKAAQDMLVGVDEKTFAGESLGIRIGINTGPVVAGAIGARGRLNYTVHGDAVNLAARLESMNKEFGTRLMISQHSVELASEFSFELVGEVSVRGQSQSIQVYTLASANPGRAEVSKTL